MQVFVIKYLLHSHDCEQFCSNKHLISLSVKYQTYIFQKNILFWYKHWQIKHDKTEIHIHFMNFVQVLLQFCCQFKHIKINVKQRGMVTPILILMPLLKCCDKLVSTHTPSQWFKNLDFLFLNVGRVESSYTPGSSFSGNVYLLWGMSLMIFIAELWCYLSMLKKNPTHFQQLLVIKLN